jgi:hypothetical protein
MVSDGGVEASMRFFCGRDTQGIREGQMRSSSQRALLVGSQPVSRHLLLVTFQGAATLSLDKIAYVVPCFDTRTALLLSSVPAS